MDVFSSKKSEESPKTETNPPKKYYIKVGVIIYQNMGTNNLQQHQGIPTPLTEKVSTTPENRSNMTYESQKNRESASIGSIIHNIYRMIANQVTNIQNTIEIKRQKKRTILENIKREEQHLAADKLAWEMQQKKKKPFKWYETIQGLQDKFGNQVIQFVSQKKNIPIKKLRVSSTFLAKEGTNRYAFIVDVGNKDSIFLHGDVVVHDENNVELQNLEFTRL